MLLEVFLPSLVSRCCLDWQSICSSGALLLAALQLQAIPDLERGTSSALPLLTEVHSPDRGGAESDEVSGGGSVYCSTPGVMLAVQRSRLLSGMLCRSRLLPSLLCCSMLRFTHGLTMPRLRKAHFSCAAQSWQRGCIGFLWLPWAGCVSCNSPVRHADAQNCATPATPSAAYAGQGTLRRMTSKPCHRRASSMLTWSLAVLLSLTNLLQAQ